MCGMTSWEGNVGGVFTKEWVLQDKKAWEQTEDAELSFRYAKDEGSLDM